MIGVPSRNPIPFPSRPTIIPDGGNYPVRLETDVPRGQLSPSHLSPACTRVSRWFATAFENDRLPALFYGADLARKAGTHARFRLLAPHVAQRPFTPPACYHRDHRYSDLMRQSAVPPHTSRPFAGYSAGLTNDRPSPL